MKIANSYLLRLWCGMTVCGIGAGCSVGPKYQRPAASGTNAMPATFLAPTGTNWGEWKIATPAANLPRGTWWEAFGDPELNRLEALASSGNQELAGAFARIQQARALTRVARADFFPNLSLNPGVTRQRTSGNQFRTGGTAGGATFDTYSFPLEASWELDFWGRVRRGVEGARHRLEAAADDLESARLSIQAEVAVDYFNFRSLGAQHALIEQTIAAYQRSLELTQNRHRSGIATEYDVSLAETQLKSAEAQLPELSLQQATFKHALATLCGQPAPGFMIANSSTGMAVAPAVPATLPSELLEHRPDIAAAERRMAAANADVGVAAAAFYPRVIINGLAGFQSADIATLFDWPSRVWSVGPSVQLPLFNAGRNRATLAAARSSYEANVADYRQTVLNAFQEVQDQLSAQGLLAGEFDAESAALDSARRTLEISNTRYKGGVITYLEVATAQNSALAHEQTVVQLSARRLSAAVALIKALGAGWTPETETRAGTRQAGGAANPNP